MRKIIEVEKKNMRAAVIVPYWDFWEKSTEYEDFRDDRMKLGHEVVDILGSADCEVSWVGVVDSETIGAEAGNAIHQQRVDVVVVIQSMAVPPSYTLAAIREIGDIPLVIWTVQRNKSLGSNFGASDITASGATVGTPMLTNVLHRQSRPHELVVGAIENSSDVTQLQKTVRAAAIAGELRQVRIGRIGAPVEGYDCVDVDAQSLKKATGIEVVDIEPKEFQQCYFKVDDEDVNSLKQQIQHDFNIESLPKGGNFESFKLVNALKDLDVDRSLDAGAMNCHVAEIRYAEDPGVTPCFALGYETTRGIPWTCSGDVVTAVAMLVAKRLSGAALYHEIEAFDMTTDEVAIANSGEHDLSWCRQDHKPCLQPNPWFSSDPKTGICAKFELPAGPATLVAFTPNGREPSGFRFVVAEGHITDRSFPANPTVGGAFRFCGNNGVTTAWARWISAGVNHHSAAGRGHIGSEVETIARCLGVGYVKVS